MADISADVVQVGQTLMEGGLSHFSVFEKLNTRTVTGLRGTSVNTPTGRTMIHVDFRWILSSQDDFNKFAEIIAQFKASPFLPFKNPVLRALIMQYTNEVFSNEDSSKTIKQLTDSKAELNSSLITQYGEFVSYLDDTVSFTLGTKRYTSSDDVFRFFYSLYSQVDPTVNIKVSLNEFMSKVVKLTQEEVGIKNLASVNLLIKEQLKTGGLTSRFYRILDTIRVINNYDTTIAKLSDTTSKSNVSVKDSLDDNVHLAASQIEWMTVPDLKIGVIAKLSCIFFNHSTHISRIKYYKHNGETTYDLAACDMFTNFRSRYQLTNPDDAVMIRTLGDESSDTRRCQGKCLNFKLADASRNKYPTEMAMDIYDWDETNIPPHRVDGKPLDPAAKKTLEEKGDLIVFEKSYTRKLNSSPIKMGFGNGDEFIERIICSINFPISIVPLLGNQHPTLQFYGRPTGTVQFILKYSEMDTLKNDYSDIDVDLYTSSDDSVNNYKALRHMFEYARARNNHAEIKFKRFNPAVLFNPLVNLGGMYNFNIESMNTTNIENEPGSVNTSLTFVEQIVPSIEQEQKIFGFIEISNERGASSFKLNEVMKFVADPSIKERYSNNLLEYYILRKEALDIITNTIITPEVWYNYAVRNNFANIFNYSENQNKGLHKVYESGDIKTQEDFNKVMKAEGKFLSSAYTFSADEASAYSVVDINPSLLTSLRYLYEIIDITGAIKNSIVSSELKTFSQYGDVSGEQDPMNLKDVTGVTNTLLEFLNTLTLNIFENGVTVRGIPRDESDIIWTHKQILANDTSEGKFELDDLPVPASLIDNLSSEDQINALTALRLPIILHDVVLKTIKLNLQQSRDLLPNKEIEELINKAINDAHPDPKLAGKDLNLYLEMYSSHVTMLVTGAILRNISKVGNALGNKGLIAAELPDLSTLETLKSTISKVTSVFRAKTAAQLVQDTEEIASLYAKVINASKTFIAKAVASPIRTALGVAVKPITLLGSVLTKVSIFITSKSYAIATVDSGVTSGIARFALKGVSGSTLAPYARILKIGSKALFVVDILMSAALAYHRVSGIKDKALNLKETVSLGLHQIFSGVLYELLSNNKIPNQTTIKELYSILPLNGVPSSALIELDDLYLKISSFSEGTISKKETTSKISAYPDMNLPTYREVSNTTTVTDISAKQNLSSLFNQLEAEVESFLSIVGSYPGTLQEQTITRLRDELITLRSGIDTYSSSIDITNLSTLLYSFGQTIVVIGSSLSLKLKLRNSKLNPIFFSTSLANITNALTLLNSELNVLVPTSVDMIVPRYDEVNKETPYVSDPYTDAGKFFARDLDDYVDPGFYIVRQDKNQAKLITPLNENGNSISDILNAPSDGSMPRVKNRSLPKPALKPQEAKTISSFGRAALPGVTNYESITTDDNTDIKGSLVTQSGNVHFYEAETNSPIEAVTSDGKRIELVSQEEQKSKELAMGYQSYLYQTEKSIRHNPLIRETISSAFPTYAIYFIREAETLEYAREFMTDVYLYQNVIDLNITSNKFTGHIATLTLANIWGSLDNNTFKRSIRDYKPGEIARPKDLEPRLRLDSMRLAEGVLIEIRHGYSANPDELDIVFTGKIAEVSAGEIVTIICQGHEHELMTKSMKSLDVGVVTGRNMYDYAAQLMSHTTHFGQPYGVHDVKEMIKSRTAHRNNIYGSDGTINLFESLLTSNLNVSRTTENIWTGGKGQVGMDWLLNQDFVLKDTTELEALHEISRYHFNHVAFPLPMDSRATMFLGPVDHLYKYTNKLNVEAEQYIRANNAIQRFANTDTLISDVKTLKESDNTLDNITAKVMSAMPSMFSTSSVLYIDRTNVQSRRGHHVHITSTLDRNVPELKSTSIGLIDNVIFKLGKSTPPGYIISSPYFITYGAGDIVLDQIDSYSFTSEFINVPIKVKVNIANSILTQFVLSTIDSFSKSKWMVRAEANRQSELKKANDFLYKIKGNQNSSAVRAYADDKEKNLKLYEFYSDESARKQDAALEYIKTLTTDSNVQRLIKGLETGGSTYMLEDILDKITDNNDLSLRAPALKIRLMYLMLISKINIFINKSSDPSVISDRADASIQRGLLSKASSQIMPPGYKPFRTFHRITDRDIVANELECTTSQMANEVHVMTPKDSTQIVSRVVNGIKEVLQFDPSESQGYWHNNVSSFSIFQSPSEKLIRRMYEPNASTLSQQANITYRDLSEAMKSMYRGQLVMVGKRSIKPYDVINLSDTYNSVYGDFEVESVTHSHTIDGGWITTVTPHLLNTHAEMQESYSRLLWNAGIGVVEGVLQALLIRSLAISVYGKVSTLVTGTFSKAALMNTGTSILFSDLATKGLGISLLGDAADASRAIVNSDFAMADWYFKPTAITCGVGMTPEDYEIERKKFGAGNTSIPDHLKPVILNPLVKNGAPWVAGLRGIRPYDTALQWGTAGAIFSQAYTQTKTGVNATKYDIDLSFKKIFNKYDVMLNNFFNL